MYCVAFMFEVIESTLESSKAWFNGLLNNNNLESFQLFFVIVTGLWILRGTFLSFNELGQELMARGECVGQKRKLGEKKIDAEIRKKNFGKKTFLLELKATAFSALIAHHSAIIGARFMSGTFEYNLNIWGMLFISFWSFGIGIVSFLRITNNRVHRIIRHLVSFFLFMISGAFFSLSYTMA